MTAAGSRRGSPLHCRSSSPSCCRTPSITDSPRAGAAGASSSPSNNDGEELSIDVVDDGHGLDPTFRIESATGLGLSIVRTLVTTELNGTIAMRPAKPVDLEGVGLESHGGDRQGTVVQLVVPLK